LSAADYIEELEGKLARLRAFKTEIIKLMMNHDTLTVNAETDDIYAVVYPARIAEVLEKFEPEWYNNCKPTE
jgi:hypothetical protein